MKYISLATIVTILSLSTFQANANPVVGSYNPNNVSIHKSGNNTVINQKTNTARIYWQSFNINSGEKTVFNQPGANSVAINRINAANGASKIYGSLISNGKIVLINQAGIHFGPGSFVSVGGLIASTTDMTKYDDGSNKFIFDIPSQYQNAAIVNEGTIQAANYGLVALLGTRVVNAGSITAHAGEVITAAGNKFTLSNDGILHFSIDEEASAGTKTTAVNNVGQVQVQPETVQKVLDNSINTEGIQEASQFAQASDGTLIFAADSAGLVQIASNQNSNSKIDVSSNESGQKGGKVKILGTNIEVGKTEIDASGHSGGGEVLVGGNYQGKGPEFNATTTKVGTDATVNANAISQGDGGKVIFWANDATTFDGTVYAQGGALSGTGGLVETSAKNLHVGPNAYVNTLSPNGEAGNWLLDPDRIIVRTGNFNTPAFCNASGGAACVAGVNQLQTALNSSNITLLSNLSIDLETGNITWGSGTTLSLNSAVIRLDQDITINGNINFNAPITAGVAEGSTDASITVNGNASFQSIQHDVHNILSVTVNGNATLNSTNIQTLDGNIIRGSNNTVANGNPSTINIAALNANLLPTINEQVVTGFSVNNAFKFMGFNRILGGNNTFVDLTSTFVNTSNPSLTFITSPTNFSLLLGNPTQYLFVGIPESNMTFPNGFSFESDTDVDVIQSDIMQSALSQTEETQSPENIETANSYETDLLDPTNLTGGDTENTIKITDPNPITGVCE